MLADDPSGYIAGADLPQFPATHLKQHDRFSDLFAFQRLGKLNLTTYNYTTGTKELKLRDRTRAPSSTYTKGSSHAYKAESSTSTHSTLASCSAFNSWSLFSTKDTLYVRLLNREKELQF